MSERVRGRLRELAAFLESAYAVESIEESIEHLHRAVAECMAQSRADAQQCTIWLFQSLDPPSLLTFLDASGAMSEDPRKRDISHARIKVLELLAEFVKAYGMHVAVTKTAICETTQRCQTIARGDWSNKVRAVALKVVINVLKYANARISVEDIDPKAYVERLFHDLKFSKASQTAKGTMLEVISHLAAVYPHYVEENARQLVPWIEEALQKQFSSATPEMLLVKGLLLALCHLVSFDPDRYEKDEVKRNTVYSHLAQVFATTVQGQLSRYDVTKSAQLFLSIRHQAFQANIGANGYLWFTYMKYCTSSENKTIKESAFSCSDGVLNSINEYLVRETDDARKKTLNRILRDLLPILSDGDAHDRQLAFAFQALGRLASAIRVILGESAFAKIEERLQKFGDTLLVLDERAAARRWTVLSNYTDCIGRFITESCAEPTENSEIEFFERLLIHMLDSYPRCLWKRKVTIYKPFLQILQVMQNRGHFQILLNRLMHHFILVSISNISQVDTVILYHPETGEIVSKLLYEYEELWVALLRGMAPSKTYRYDAKLHNKHTSWLSTREHLVDATMDSIIQVTKELDVSYTYDLQDVTGNSYKPTVPRDHTILLNLTEFIERLVPRLKPITILPWIPHVMRTMFKLATRLPLVSSFYRIVRVFTDAAKDEQYFQTASTSDSHTKAMFCAEYCAFIKRIVHNLPFYKDELFIACSSCALVAPIQYLEGEDYLKVLISTLDIGKSYLPAAVLCMSSLEARQRMKCEQLRSIYADIIPSLLSFLSDADDDNRIVCETMLDSNAANCETLSDWSNFRLRVIRFIGKVGVRTSELVETRQNLESRRGFQSRMIKLGLSMDDVDVLIGIDNLIDSVGRTAQETTDRRIKASACEAFHALVCLLCGHTASQPHTSGTKSAFFNLWETVFSSIMKLATDPDKISRSLFEPLLFQLATWHSRNCDTFPFEYSRLLDELLNGLCHQTDSALREISGKCLASCLTTTLEFAATGSGMEKTEAIFQRLFSLCRHPGPAQRIGAATAISYFLRTLKEDNVDVIKTFGLQCVKHFLVSLRLCDRDSRRGESGIDASREVITKAIMKLQRAICRFPNIFLDCPKKEHEGLLCDAESNLAALTTWLFEQCSSSGKSYRKMCRTLFFCFSKLVSGSTCKAWLQTFISTHGAAKIHRIFAPVESLVDVPTVSADDDTSARWGATAWFDQLSASLDCYTWAIEVLESNSELLFKDEDFNSLKRKSSLPTCGDENGKRLTLFWALQQFFAIDVTVLSLPQLNHSVTVFSSIQQLLDSYIDVVVQLCELNTLRFKGSTSGFISMIGLRADSCERGFASALILCIRLIHTLSFGDRTDALQLLKDFCQNCVCTDQQMLCALRRAAVDALHQANAILGDTSLTRAQKRESRKLLTVVKVLAGCGLLNTDETDIFVNAALEALEDERPTIEDREFALEAIKVALCFGWDFTQTIDNFSLRRKLDPIFLASAKFLSEPCVWNQSGAKVLRRTDTAALHTLSIVLSDVLTTKSSNNDTFVETLLPVLKLVIGEATSSDLDSEKQRMCLDVVLKAVTIFQKTSTTIQDTLRIGPLPDIRTTVLNLLKRRTVSHFVKGDCLSILAALGPCTNEDEEIVVLDSLGAFIVEEFPICSTDVKKGSRDHDIYTHLMERLVHVIEEYRKVVYIRVLDSTLKEGTTHLLAPYVDDSMGRLATNVVATSPDDQVAFVGDLLLFLIETSNDVRSRSYLLNHLFVPLMELVSPEVLKAFFLTKRPNGVFIISMLGTIVAGSPDVVSAGALFTAAVAFAAVEILYRLLDPEFIRGGINSTFLGHSNGKGREFTMLVCKCASKFATKKHDESSTTQRFSCSQAYVCLLTAVSRTQKQEKFFDQILFQESLWSNVIDVSHEYELRCETPQFDTIPLSRFSSNTLRRHWRGSRRYISRQYENKRQNASALSFFSASSLSQSFSPSFSSQTFNTAIEPDGSALANITIELDAINEHPCMISLLRVLVQMKIDFGESWNQNVMPGWMMKVFQVASDPVCELNVRLFLVKVVLNVPNVFSVYSSKWAEVIFDVLLEATHSASDAPAEFNYMLRDCCNVLLSEWNLSSILSIRVVASRFVNQLIELAPNTSNHIMQDNVRLICLLIERWKDDIRVDVEQLSRLVLSSHENARYQAAERFTGLQLISAMLNAGLANELTAGYRVDNGNTLLGGVLESLLHRRGMIHNVAAEVSGLLLSKCHDLIEFESNVVEVIIKQFNDEDYGRFLSLLRNTSMYRFSIINSAMLHRLSFILPKVIGIEEWSRNAIECMIQAVKNPTVANEVFTHCERHLARFVCHQSNIVQLAAMHLVDILVPYMQHGTLARVSQSESTGGLGLLCSIRTHNEAIRRVQYKIIQHIYLKESDSVQKNQLRRVMVAAFADPDQDIKQDMYDFWQSTELLPLDISSRVLALFSSLFSSDTADLWPLFATNCLLRCSTTSNQYEEPIFTNPLGSCEFHEQTIDSSWESKNHTMTPLFSMETAKLPSSHESEIYGSESSSVSSIDSGAYQSQLISSTIASQAGVSSRANDLPVHASLPTHGTSKRRFYFRHQVANQGTVPADKTFFQDRFAVKARSQIALANRQQVARANEVTLRRRYRFGDYPDIQITRKDIVGPLMELCARHRDTSTLVLAALLPSIIATINSSETTHVLIQNMTRALVEGAHSLPFVSAVHLALFSCLSSSSTQAKVINLDPITLGESSLRSGGLTSGLMVVEQVLLQNLGCSQETVAICSDQLYKLLAAMKNDNFLVALAYRFCTLDDSKLSLQAQISGDLPSAIALYRKAENTLEDSIDNARGSSSHITAAQLEGIRDYWQRLACLETLNHWKKLQKECQMDQQSPLLHHIWKGETPYRERYLGHILRSYLGMIGESITSDQLRRPMEMNLQLCVDEARKDSVCWNNITTQYGVELCLSFLVLGKPNEARVYLEGLYLYVLRRWNATSRVALASRREIMQTLSSAVEIDQLLSESSDVASFDQSNDRCFKILQSWLGARPGMGAENIGNWSQYHMVQRHLFGYLIRRSACNGALPDSDEHAVFAHLSQLMLYYAKAAVSSNILALASKYLKEYRELCNVKMLPKVSVLMVEVFVSHVLKLADKQARRGSHQSIADEDEFSASALAAVRRYYQTAMKMFDNADILEIMDILSVDDRIALGCLEARTFGKAASFYLNTDVDLSIARESYTRSFDVFERTCRAIPFGVSHANVNQKRVVFIEFLIESLFSEQSVTWTSFVDRETLVQALADNILHGMASGDMECSNYFAQMLELIPPYPAIVKLVEQFAIENVPAWTCLRWTSQLLALSTGPIGSSIIRILEKMANNYPVALFYEFKVVQSSASTKEFKRLSVLLSNQVMEKFVQALRLLHHPELRLKEGLKDVAKLLDDGKGDAAKMRMQIVWQDCFAIDNPLLGTKIGNYNRDWARRSRRDIEKILGKEAANINNKTVTAAREWILSHFSVVPGRHGISKDMTARLADFSDWLDEFDHSKHSLELPGQYTKRWGKPDPSTHVRILSFKSQLGVLVSKQLPKQITVHCSDRKDYTFLVKGGEDLRLDQRIEQLFEVMNQILSAYPRCKSRNLHTTTYKVIPMTTEIGLIEWLHKTSTLKRVIEGQLQQDSRCSELVSNKRGKLQLFNTVPAKKYESFLMKQRGSSFASKVAAPAQADVEMNLQAVQELIPADLLRLQLLNLGVDFEDFITIRDHFASSLAVFSACSYILGIGDRHLDNFLLDLRSGRVIGIDFGVSFGAGASMLPVPELVPFRFTRQFEFVFAPYDGANLILQDMQSVFDALREKKQVIESVMNVFLHEPLLDWKQSTTTHQREIFASNRSAAATTQGDDADIDDAEIVLPHTAKRVKRHLTEGGVQDDKSNNSSSSYNSVTPSVAWLPDVKIAIARRKLDGLSPRLLLKEELAQNPHLGKHVQKFGQIVDRAVPSTPPTAIPMSSVAQAEELLMLATAPDLLGRTFQGWMPWL